MKRTALKLAAVAGLAALGAAAPLQLQANADEGGLAGLAFSDAWCAEMLGTCWDNIHASCHMFPDPVEDNRCDSSDDGCTAPDQT